MVLLNKDNSAVRFRLLCWSTAGFSYIYRQYDYSNDRSVQLRETAIISCAPFPTVYAEAVEEDRSQAVCDVVR